MKRRALKSVRRFSFIKLIKIIFLHESNHFSDAKALTYLYAE